MAFDINSAKAALEGGMNEAPAAEAPAGEERAEA